MRYSGWARVTFIGDTVAAQQLVPLGRAVLGEVLNRLDMQRESVRSVRRLAWESIGQRAPQAFKRPFGSTLKTYADGSVIEAGWDGTTPWIRITTSPTSTSPVLNGFGFILSPFNGSLPVDGSPNYKSTLLLINGGAYGNDYPDSDHHWFTVDTNGDYFDLGNEFLNNGLLQGNLHWRSKVDTTFHLSWLANPSDPIPYFNINFQTGYDGGNSPYALRLSSTTTSPPQTGAIFNFDTTQVFSAWLADSFGGLHNLQNATGIGQVICYKGHVVKSVYDLLKPGSPVTVRNCIVGAGGAVDSDTKKRTLYFVVRAFEQALPTYILTETVYSLAIDDVTAIPVQIGTRAIETTGSYNTAVSVDPIPLHGYQWIETSQQFVCVAAQASTTPFADTSTQPVLQVHNVSVQTGKATWTIAGGAASFGFDNAQTITGSPLPTYNAHFHSNFGNFFSPEFGNEQYLINSVVDASVNYTINDGVIGVTPLNDITTSCIYSATEHVTANESDFVFDPASPIVVSLTTEVTESTSASFTQSITCGNKTFDVAAFTFSTSQDELQSFTDVSGEFLTQNLLIKEKLSYIGKAFLWFNDVDKVFAYLEYQLTWDRTVTQNYTDLRVAGIPPFPTAPPPVEVFNLTSYQGRYVVDSTKGLQQTDWFDLTAGGQIGNAPGHNNLFAFMPKFPLHIVSPTSPGNIDATVVSNAVSPTSSDQVYTKTYNPLPLFELVNIISCSYYNIPKWQPSSSYFTGVGGRVTTFMEPDGTYAFSATHAGGWAVNGKTLCFSQIGPTVLDTLGSIASQSPFQFLTTGDLDALTGTTTDARGNYPLCAIVSREILAQGQT